MLNLEAKTNNERIVLDYLNANASEALVEKINNGKKTMAQCWSFIESEARKMVENPSGNVCVALDDATVFGWAVHFFEEDSIKAESYNAKPTAKVRTTKPVEKPVEAKKPAKIDKKPSGEQLSFFD